MKINSEKIIKKIKKMSLYEWILLILIISLVLLIIKKNYSPKYEGFSQRENFIVKKDSQIFDDFYANIFDQLFFKQFSTNYEIGSIVNETSPTEKSIILDIGSKTGNVVGLLQERGFDNVTGLDQSQSMITKSKENYPTAKFLKGSPTQSMTFDRESFTHIMILNQTFYMFNDQRQIIQNCYDWLKPGGYFIINLVNKDLFDPLPPCTNPLFLVSPQRFSKKRITKGKATFNNFNYESNFFTFPNDNVMYQEIFKDTTTGNVRQNELGLTMPKQATVVSMCSQIGFNSLSKIDLVKGQKSYQYLYIFYKPN